jgi:D-alanyl-D-alanine carboxypeptidase (penicillin-binding protein 5/6)
MNRAGIAALAALSLAAAAVVAVLLWNGRAVDAGSGAAVPASVDGLHGGALSSGAAGLAGGRPSPATRFAIGSAAPVAVSPKLKDPPAAGLLFDLDSGAVLWKRSAGRPLPIASLTKMMTALLISERDGFDERVRISRRAADTHGSKLGVLPTGKRVPLKPLFYALIMASANDAAVALAEHDSGSVSAFVERMNREARLMGLDCTRFSTPSGLKNRGNRSCALDLAELARADLADQRIARVARTRRASFPFPGKVGTLDLYNNHYFLSRGIAGLPGARVTGLKTGYTIAAGRCYVTTVRLDGRGLGVVLLNSPDPLRQVPQLLRAGFAAEKAG